jgi:hypothetical protein
MLDFGKLGDMAKLAQEAKQMQAQQEHFQKEQLDILRKISKQIDELLIIAKEKK